VNYFEERVNITPLIQDVEIVCDSKTFKTFVTRGTIKHTYMGFLPDTRAMVSKM